jgi:hypothetical protein
MSGYRKGLPSFPLLMWCLLTPLQNLVCSSVLIYRSMPYQLVPMSTDTTIRNVLRSLSWLIALLQELEYNPANHNIYVATLRSAFLIFG